MGFLAPGEKVQRRIRPSRFSPFLIKFYLGAAVSPILGLLFLAGVIMRPLVILGTDIVFYFGLVLVLLGAFSLVYGEVKRKWFGEYILTNLRIIVRKGLFRTQVDSVTNKMIVNVKAIQTLPQKIFGVGDVDVTTSRGDKEIEMRDISGYRDVENLIYKLMETRETEQPQGKQGAQAPAAAPDEKTGSPQTPAEVRQPPAGGRQEARPQSPPEERLMPQQKPPQQPEARKRGREPDY